VADLVEETPWRWRIDPVGEMRVPGIVFGSRELLRSSSLISGLRPARRQLCQAATMRNTVLRSNEQTYISPARSVPNETG
jgi:hypothetical protein